MDSYFTIAQPACGEYKEKGSKFLAFAFEIEKEEQLQDKIHKVTTEHPKARHYCFAYKIGITSDIFRMNDDGEPSGSAGKPIFGQIQSFGVSDVLVIVVRYFGGTKLGISGLIQAYKNASMEALQQAGKKEKFLYNQYELYFPLSEMGHVYHILKSIELDVLESQFNENPSISFSIRRSVSENTLLLLKAGVLKIPVEQAKNTESWGSFECNKKGLSLED